MYCQSCGAENINDARFCNMCGSGLAQAGEAGGLVATLNESTEPESKGPAQMPAPTAGPRNAPGATRVGTAPPAASTSRRSGYGTLSNTASMMNVSLAGIGVRSSKKTWLTISFIAVGLICAGALASWLAMGGNEAAAGHADAEDPFVIGSPTLPDEDEVDSVSGTMGVESSADPDLDMAEPSEMTQTMRPVRRPRTMRANMRTGSNNSMGETGMSGGSGTTGSGSTGSGTTGSGSTGSGDHGSTGNEDHGSTGSDNGTMSGSTNMGGGDGGGDGEEPGERDIEMELYSARVRYLIRRYYAARAQRCFDHATRNNPSMSGTVVVGMTIGADGSVSRTSVSRNTTGDETLGRCLANQVSTWRLSSPPGGSLQMQMPFSR